MKNKKTPVAPPKSTPKPVTPTREVKREKRPSVFEAFPYSQRNVWILYGIIAVTCLVAYSPSLFNEFTWDARKYILENNYLKDFPGWDGWVAIFTKFELGNYQPITMLSWAIEYMIVGTSPWLYHLDNALLHIVNSILVYRVVQKLNGKFLVAAITAILFAIHPLKVESVVWAAERKDTMYTLFLLLSFEYYINWWQQEKRTKMLILSIVFFVLSCFSKAMAVVLPLVLIITDMYFFDRVKSFGDLIKVGLQKFPYFAIALGVGILSIIAQRDAGADATTAINSQYSFVERSIIILYNFFFYPFKTIFPVDLRAFYSYPDKPFPAEIYLGMVGTFGLAVAAFVVGRKNNHVAWGMLYYLIVILPVIQILPIGSAIVADRYYYVSSLGLLYILGVGVNHLYEHRENFRKAFKVVAVGVCLLLTGISFARSFVWKDDLSLFMDVLEKYPSNGFIAGNVGWSYVQKKDTTNAILYFEKANQLGWNTDEIHIKLADLYFQRKDYEKAARNFAAGFKLKPEKNKNLYWSLGTCYYYMTKYDSAMIYSDLALKEDIKNFFAHNIKGLVYTKTNRFEEAKQSFLTSIKYNKKFYDPYVNIAHVYDLEGRYDQEIPYLIKALGVDPKQDLAYKNIGVAYVNMGQYDKAIEYWKKAIRYHPTQPSFEYNIGLQLAQHGRVAEGVEWLRKAARKGEQNAVALLKARGYEI
jgi:protein O-mannosyl-transferase